jgi:tetratricopeptide (TPR) repeat protein
MATEVKTRMTSIRAQTVVDVESLGGAILTWVQRYRALLMGVSALIVFVVMGMWYMGHRTQVALDDLRVGVAEFQAGNGEKAISHLERVRGASAVGAEAQALGNFYLGEAYMKAERKDDAKKAFEEALALVKSNGEKSAYLQQMILMKLAQDAMLRGDQAQARQWYDQAAVIEGPLQSEAIVQAGLVVKKTDKAAATTYYEKLIAKDANHPLADVLGERVGK